MARLRGILALSLSLIAIQLPICGWGGRAFADAVLPASIPDAYPSGENTGPPEGAAMKVFRGTYAVTQDNSVISNLEIHGIIVVYAKGVRMTNIRLIAAPSPNALTVSEKAEGFVLEHSEIDGGGISANGIFGFGTFRRNNIHDVENGLNVNGPSVIRENFIHTLRGAETAHYDGVEVNGGRDIDIIRNTVINDHEQTAAVMLNNYFSGLANITVDGNLLIGGGYTVYLDGRFAGGTVDDASIRITRNRIGKGVWGNFAFYDDTPVEHGNVGLDNPPPEPASATEQ